MEKISLSAYERIKNKKKFREEGFVPGVIYGDTIEGAASVKFQRSPLIKILEKHGSNAKLWINYADTNSLGFIKEIQRHPVNQEIIHVDVQLVSKNHEIKLELPLLFKGEDALTSKGLQLQVHKLDVEVCGRMALMPDLITVDVADLELNSTITKDDLNLDKDIKIIDNEEVFATISYLREETEPEDEETVSASEPETETV